MGGLLTANWWRSDRTHARSVKRIPYLCIGEIRVSGALREPRCFPSRVPATRQTTRWALPAHPRPPSDNIFTLSYRCLTVGIADELRAGVDGTNGGRQVDGRVQFVFLRWQPIGTVALAGGADGDIARALRWRRSCSSDSVSASREKAVVDLVMALWCDHGCRDARRSRPLPKPTPSPPSGCKRA